MGKIDGIWLFNTCLSNKWLLFFGNLHRHLLLCYMYNKWSLLYKNLCHFLIHYKGRVNDVCFQLQGELIDVWMLGDITHSLWRACSLKGLTFLQWKKIKLKEKMIITKSTQKKCKQHHNKQQDHDEQQAHCNQKEGRREMQTKHNNKQPSPLCLALTYPTQCNHTARTQHNKRLFLISNRDLRTQLQSYSSKLSQSLLLLTRLRLREIEW